MGIGVSRSLFAMAACLVWLAGCETTSQIPNPFKSSDSPLASAADPEPTGSVAPLFGDKGDKPDLVGNDPYDDLSIGKKYFRQGSFGLAERHFRKSVEEHPKDAESWVGLAASYDRLRRFDLADRAYAQATKLLGSTTEILNNQGFSYMLRGDAKRARETLLLAQSREPNNPYVLSNLKLLEDSQRKRKGIN
jgi:tetratricopeptide (TPR) repeat protein